MVPLIPPADTWTARLRLAPTEPRQYTSTTHAIVADGTNEPRYDLSIPRQNGQVRLDVGDFPIAFLPLRGDQAVLNLCSVHAAFQPGDPHAAPARLELDADHRSVALTQPVSAADGTLILEFRPLDGAPQLRLTPPPAMFRIVSLASLQGYDPQQVVVSALFLDSDDRIPLDLVPERRTDAPGSVTTVLLTPVQPHVIWRYVSTSPFQAIAGGSTTAPCTSHGWRYAPPARP
ncbi:hypothetical protein ACI8AK_05215 [Geodermatophilus sp. SYSU D00867]